GQWLPVLDMSPQDVSSNELSISVRVMLANGKLAAAAQLLDSYYGSDTGSALPNPDLDLARLRYLLAADKQQAALQWIDGLSDRCGVLTRQRADQIALGLLSPSASSSQQSQPMDAGVRDPRLVAAAGMQAIRKKDLDRGATLLAAAAMASGDESSALEYATQSAAAYRAGGDTLAAFEILSTVAKRFPAADSAARLHLQSLQLLTSVNKTRPASSEIDIDPLLQQHLSVFASAGSSASTAAAARLWLASHRRERGQHESVIDVIVQAGDADVTEGLAKVALGSMIDLAVRDGMNDETVQQLANRLNQWLTKVASTPKRTMTKGTTPGDTRDFTVPLITLRACVLDPSVNHLSLPGDADQRGPGGVSNIQERFATQLLFLRRRVLLPVNTGVDEPEQFRWTNQESSFPDEPPLIRAAVQRLLADMDLLGEIESMDATSADVRLQKRQLVDAASTLLERLPRDDQQTIRHKIRLDIHAGRWSAAAQSILKQPSPKHTLIATKTMSKQFSTKRFGRGTRP
ncbi:MAG: hypothetical protein AAFN70_12190, partial [Planctomycetota bacterium]